MYTTEQEVFWAGEFGNEYINRNQGEKLLACNLNFFTKALQHASNIKSCLEFGANIGMNIKSLQLLFPQMKLSGIEINETASKELSDVIGKENVYNTSIFDINIDQKFDLVLIKGVLIHINPERLTEVYQKLYNHSSKYILIAEYYNPTPVTVQYRGHDNKLFKRDFAGEFLDLFPDAKLVDYGFIYKRDLNFPQDDFTWFLIEKQ